MSRLQKSDRRMFLKQAALGAFAAPAFIRNLTAAAPSEVVRHASFGASGMAGADLGAIISHPKVKLVCVADVDIARAEALKKQHPDLRVYRTGANCSTRNTKTWTRSTFQRPTTCMLRSEWLRCSEACTAMVKSL